MSDIRAAGVIAFMQEKKERVFLLLRSAKNGEWGPPKGKLEAGESEMEAALRETYEEAGLRRLQFKQGFRESITYQVTKKGKVSGKQVTYFLAEIGDADNIELSVEHTEAHLGTLDEIEQLVSHENLRAVFRCADEYLKRAK